MEAMKINISVQRKTNIESNRTPNQKTKISKVETPGAVWPLVLAVGPAVTEASGRTGQSGGRTGQEQRRITVLKTAREQDLKSI